MKLYNWQGVPNIKQVPPQRSYTHNRSQINQNKKQKQSSKGIKIGIL